MSTNYGTLEDTFVYLNLNKMNPNIFSDLLHANTTPVQQRTHFNQHNFISKVKWLALVMMLAFLNCIQAQLPTITSFVPEYGPPGTLVTVTGTSLNSPVAFSIGGVAAIRVSCTSTQLVGLVMPGAITGPVSVTTADGNITSVDNFNVTTTGYPIQQGDKLVGADGEGASQGCSVHLSADGNTAIVGGFADNGEVGAAWVYSRSGGIWSQQGTKLVGTGAIGRSDQGSSVALSSDGSTAIVGGYGDNGDIGAAWIFIRSNGVWSQQGPKLVGEDFIGRSEQGSSVSISSDGNTAIVGGYHDNANIGAAWIFTRSDGLWSQQGNKLVDQGGEGSEQGRSVSLAADGNTAIIGGLYNLGGAAWIFTRSGGVWSQSGSKLVVDDAEGDAMAGVSVSLSSDGKTAIIGGFSDNNYLGAAWIFTYSGGLWAQQGKKLVGTDAEITEEGGVFQGCSVSMSSDGNTVIFGGWYDYAGQGAAWVFTRSAGTWVQKGYKLVGTGSVGRALLGFSVCISSDGSTAIIGGMGDNDYTGAAWIYTSEIILPVSFINISANRVNGGALVDWKVAATTNIRYYEVERSTDGRSFILIGKVASSAANNYSYTDDAAGKDLLYYRIKSIGFAGEISYTSIVKLSIGNIEPNYSIYPNPVENGVLNLQFRNQKKGNYTIKLLSNEGQLVFSSIFAHVGGTVNQLLKLPETMKLGTYQLQIIAPDKKRTTQKLFVNPGR